MKSKQHILVTGGAGYIGSHACKALVQAGYIPVAYDNLVYGHEWAVKWGPFEKGDINDRQCLNEVIEKYQPIAAMHFAAYAYVGESVEDPGKYYRNNVAGTLTLLEALRDAGINKFIFSSSCAVYGMPKKIPIPENHQMVPVNPYGRSKLMIEQMLEDFDTAYDLKSISLRYFNAVGADPDGETWEDHEPETHLIPLVLDVAAGIRSNITVFGDDYDTDDGTCVRDYIHVVDLANAHVLALKALEKALSTTAYNLGNGKGHSVLQIIEAAKRITGKEINVVKGRPRPGDPSCLVADASKIREELDWQTRFADIEKSIETAWKLYEKKKN